MADEVENEEDLENEVENQEDDAEKESLAQKHKDLIDQIVADKLKQMKANQDKAYKKLEEITRENARLKAEKTQQKQKQLEDEGKHFEAAKLKLAEQDETIKILNDKLTSITRDRELEKHLSSLEFRNDFARETAFKTIIQELVQDSDGTWVHSSGASIKEYLTAFAKDPNKDFLFKPKENSGTGSPTGKGSTQAKRPAKLSDLSSEQLLKLAQEGLLGKPGSF